MPFTHISFHWRNCTRWLAITSLALAAAAHAIAPSTVAQDPTNMTGDTAVLNALVNPSNLATNVTFRWAAGTSGCGNTGTYADQSPLPAGNADVPVSLRIIGLVRGTTYTFCVTATNATGSSQSVRSFTAPNTPAVTIIFPPQQSSSIATLIATADPRGSATTGWFRYSDSSPGRPCDDSFGTRVPATGGAALGSGSTPQVWSQTISGLSSFIYYYVCAVAQNSAGTSFSEMATVTMPPPLLDVDRNGVIDANTDGLLVVRYLLGLRGSALVAGALGVRALRSDPGEIEDHIRKLTQ